MNKKKKHIPRKELYLLLKNSYKALKQTHQICQQRFKIYNKIKIKYYKKQNKFQLKKL